MRRLHSQGICYERPTRPVGTHLMDKAQQLAVTNWQGNGTAEFTQGCTQAEGLISNPNPEPALNSVLLQ